MNESNVKVWKVAAHVVGYAIAAGGSATGALKIMDYRMTQSEQSTTEMARAVSEMRSAQAVTDARMKEFERRVDDLKTASALTDSRLNTLQVNLLTEINRVGNEVSRMGGKVDQLLDTVKGNKPERGM